MRRPAAVFTIALALGAIILAPGALATTMIGNTPPWPGCCQGSVSSGIGAAGPPNYYTPTMGQTVTVPMTDTKLDSFTFYVDLPTNLIFRGEVYAWDPNTLDPNNSFAMGSATGPALYASGQMQTTSYGNGFAPQPITFNIPGGLPLTAGAQYVLFFTLSMDATNAGDGGFVGYTSTDTYPDGDWVYIDDGGDANQWDDLAFQASFSSPLPTSKAQCMNGGWKNFGTTFKNQGDLRQLRRQRRQEPAQRPVGRRRAELL
jgi:hypothetical protein